MFSLHEDPQASPSERRDGPRFSVSSNALIRLSPTLTFRVQVRNLSLSAAQIVCEPRYALLVPLEPEAIPGKKPLIEISIALPGPIPAGDSPRPVARSTVSNSTNNK